MTAISELTQLTYDTNTVALDKALRIATARHLTFAVRANCMALLANRMVRAVGEIGLTLPEEMR